MLVHACMQFCFLPCLHCCIQLVELPQSLHCSYWHTAICVYLSSRQMLLQFFTQLVAAANAVGVPM